MFRPTALALSVLACAFALTARAADPPEKMAGTWVANLDAKTKDYLTLKFEDGTWTVTGVYKVGDKEVGSYTGEGVGTFKDSLKFKKVHVKKPFPSAKDGELFTAGLDKDSLALTRHAGKNKVTTHYAAADAAKVDPKVDPKVEAKGERYTKPDDKVTAKPGDTVRFVVVQRDIAGITEKHIDALKKGKLTKLESSFTYFNEDGSRLELLEVGDLPKDVELVKGTYYLDAVGNRNGSLKGLEHPKVAASMYFSVVKLPAQCNLTDIKYLGEAKGKFKARTDEPFEGTIHVIDAKLAKSGK